MTVSNFQKLISQACEAAGLKIKAHRRMPAAPPAERGQHTRALQAYLGHSTHRQIYRTGTDRFKGWWKD
jgi:hypothetical protein